MAFWGAVISRKSPYIHCAHGHSKRLRITQASLGVTDTISKEKRVVVLCTQGEEKKFPLCVLIPEKVESQSLKIELDPEDDVEILVNNGSTKVSLSGFFLNAPDSLISNKADTSDTDGEDIQHSDTKGSCDSEDDDYDYDDAFIVDDRNFEDDSDCPKSKLKYFGSRKKKIPRALSFYEDEVNSSYKHHKAINSPVMKPIAKPKFEGKRLTPAFDI